MASTIPDVQQDAGEKKFEGTRSKVSSHLSQNEALIFEKSSPGKKGYKLPPLDVPEVDASENFCPARFERTQAACRS